MMSRLRARWRKFRPNHLQAGQLAFVAMQEDGTPSVGAWEPFSATQIIGGHAWTLSIIHRKPLVSAPRATLLADRQLLEDALDLLEGEHSDPKSAAVTLRQALDA